MSEVYSPEAQSPAFPTAMILQIEQPGVETPLRFSTIIRNLAGGVATLEVNDPETIVEWESLKGKCACLRLLNGTGEVSDLRGVVNWAQYSVQGLDSGILNLGLTLTDADLAAQKRLAACIQHPAKDLKGFWDRYDQAQGNNTAPELSPLSTKIGLATLNLLLLGLALQFAEARALKGMGLLLWYGGIALVASQVLRYWKSLKTSR